MRLETLLDQLINEVIYNLSTFDFISIGDKFGLKLGKEFEKSDRESYDLQAKYVAMKLIGHCVDTNQIVQLCIECFASTKKGSFKNLALSFDRELAAIKKLPFQIVFGEEEAKANDEFWTNLESRRDGIRPHQAIRSRYGDALPPVPEARRIKKGQPLPVPEPVYDLKLLARAIARAFNAPEFEELLLAIEVDSADVSGDSMKARAISLVQLCRRHNKLKELVTECRGERPKVDWNIEKK